LDARRTCPSAALEPHGTTAPGGSGPVLSRRIIFLLLLLLLLFLLHRQHAFDRSG
jgi:hypothetical protein